VGSAGVAIGGGGACTGAGRRHRGIEVLGANFGLAVAAGLEFGERHVTLLHRFVVGALARETRVDLVRRDGLLLERERLFLEQRVVFVHLVGFELLRPLGLHDVQAQLAVDLGDLVSGRGGHFGHAIVSRALVASERRFHGLAFLRQALLERQHQRDIAEFIARRRGQRELRLAARYCVRSVRPAPAVRSAATISRCQ
jgi:hypothetical protein